MKRVLCFIGSFLILSIHCAVAQVGIGKLHNEKISYTFIQHLGGLHKTGPNFGMLHSKTFAHKRIPELLTARPIHNETKNKSKLQKNSLELQKDAFVFGTFSEPQDGGGIDIKLPGRTSLNVDLNGCYEGAGQKQIADEDSADSCGQSPDLDMSLSLTFDLK